jgi:two-component system, OmpR family, sensor kinase
MWKWGLLSRLSWAFLWRLQIVVMMVMILYLGVVLIAFNDIKDLFVREKKWTPRDIVVDAVVNSRIVGGKVSVAQPSLKRIEEKKGWLQVLDAQGREIYAYRKPDSFPTRYYASELADLKEFDDRKRGYHLYTWIKSVQGQTYTYILGRMDTEEELLYRVRVSTRCAREGIHIPSSLLRELDQRGMWLQVLDEYGVAVYQYQAEGKPNAYPPGMFVDYVQDHNVIYQEGEMDGRRWTWLAGVALNKNTDVEVPTHFESAHSTKYRDHVYLFCFWGNILLVLAIAALFGYQMGRPMVHMMVWLQRLAQGDYQEPTNKKGWPKSRKANGSLRRSYRIYREVIESLKDLTKILRQNDERRRRLEKTREDWIAGVSHDLRTPLSSVKGYADLLAEEQYDWKPAEIRRYAGVIRDKAHYMEQLIADLNLTFRLKNAALPLQLAEHDLVEVVRQTVIDVMNDPCSEAYALSFQPFVDRVMVRLDKEWFQRALHNLLANAVTHNPPGTEVKVSVRAETDRMVIVVEDDGQGMDEETQGMLFERYYRGTNTAKRSQGTGLGMAIAKQLIEAHGGEIHISSQIGRGTKISVWLPKRHNAEVMVESRQH